MENEYNLIFKHCLAGFRVDIYLIPGLLDGFNVSCPTSVQLAQLKDMHEWSTIQPKGITLLTAARLQCT